MTQEQLDAVIAQSNINYNNNPRWRKGQSFFNTLHMMHPEESEKIRGTEYDPFFKDDVVNKTLKYLKDEDKQEV